MAMAEHQKDDMREPAETDSDSDSDSGSGQGSEAESVEGYPVLGDHPESEHYSRIVQRLWSNLPDSSSSDDEDDQLFRDEAAHLARAALDHYNDKEGTNYMLHEAGTYLPINFIGALVYHLSFTAKEEENSPSPHRFFTEVLAQYGRGCCVLDCIKMDSFAPERIRKGCIYCPEHVEHPPVENCRYGANEKDDEKELEGKIWVNVPSGSAAKEEADCPPPPLTPAQAPEVAT